MKSKLLFTTFLMYLSFISCKHSSADKGQEETNDTTSERSVDHIDEQPAYNGDYCATIEYYNPSTGSKSTYTLTIEVEEGTLVKIEWPNGGWLDSSHFTPEEVSEDGTCNFTTFDGKEYSISINEEGGCSNSSNVTIDQEDESEGDKSHSEQKDVEEQDEETTEEESQDF